MGDEPVGDRDDDVSVTATFDQAQIDALARLFPDARSNPERLRRAVWLVTNASRIELEDGRDADENG